MFIGARVAYSHGKVSKFGVAVSVDYDKITIKFDDGIVTEVNPERVQLLNYWKTFKGVREIGEYKTFPNTTTAEQIFMSTKPIVFGQAGIRAVWYWANNIVFDNKMKEPKFKATNAIKQYGLYSNNEISISSRCHNFLEFTNTVVHEQIHQMNIEIEHSNYKLQGSHGAAFLRWIPIIKAKTGLIITVLADATKDVTDYKDIDTSVEPTTTEFIFLVFRVNAAWFGILAKDLNTLSSLAGQVDSILSRQTNVSKIYAGRSNLIRVRRELNTSIGGSLPNKLSKIMATKLIKLLENTCTPIPGYRTPEIKED